jgi:hypothetical protein
MAKSKKNAVTSRRQTTLISGLEVGKYDPAGGVISARGDLLSQFLQQRRRHANPDQRLPLLLGGG